MVADPGARGFRRDGWLVRLEPNAAADVKLFCFPYAGAGGEVYRRWTAAAPRWVELYGLQVPGHGARLAEPAPTDLATVVDRAADALAAQIDRPYAIFGHSLGAVVGFETTRELERRGVAAPLALYLSGHRAPHVPLARRPMRELDEAAFLLELKGLNGMSEEVLASPELLELLLPTLRADFTLADGYVTAAERAVACPVVALGAFDDPHVSAPALEAWRSVTSGDFSSRLFPGDHFYLFAAGDEPLLAHVATDLSHRLDQWTRGREPSRR